MLTDRIAILWRDPAIASELRELVTSARPFHTLCSVDLNDSAALQTFSKSLESSLPHAVFYEVAGFEDVAEILRLAAGSLQPYPLIPYYREIPSLLFLELQRFGICRFLHLPVKPADLEATLAGFYLAPAQPAPESEPMGKIISCLPAKPGSGASVTAYHLAHSAASILNARVALLDLDLTCGVQSLIARVEHRSSLSEIVSSVHRHGRVPEDRLLTRCGSIDLFCSFSRSRSVRIDTAQFAQFLDVLRRTYPLVVADHSGNLERFSIQVLDASALSLCICTGDHLALALASSVRQLLQSEPLQNLRLVLNRRDARFTIDARALEERIGLPVIGSLPNCFAGLQHAVRTGSALRPSSAYGGAIQTLTASALHHAGLSPVLPQEPRQGGILAAFGLGGQNLLHYS